MYKIPFHPQITAQVTHGHTAQNQGTESTAQNQGSATPASLRQRRREDAGRTGGGGGAKRPARSRTEPREVARNKGSDERAPQCALFYSTVTKALATAWGKAIVSTNRAALPAKPKKRNLWDTWASICSMSAGGNGGGFPPLTFI